MKDGILIDTKLKSKIEDAYEMNGVYTIKFKDLQDAFWFDDKVDLQEFLNIQAKERYYDKKLRNGYFDYRNENNEMLRYYVTSTRGTLTVTKEENMGIIE